MMFKDETLEFVGTFDWIVGSETRDDRWKTVYETVPKFILIRMFRNNCVKGF